MTDCAREFWHLPFSVFLVDKYVSLCPAWAFHVGRSAPPWTAQGFVDLPHTCMGDIDINLIGVDLCKKYHSIP